VNKILVKALAADILVTANHLPYDVGYEKIRAWGRQWKCDILKRLTSQASWMPVECV